MELIGTAGTFLGFVSLWRWMGGRVALQHPSVWKPLCLMACSFGLGLASAWMIDLVQAGTVSRQWHSPAASATVITFFATIGFFLASLLRAGRRKDAADAFAATLTPFVSAEGVVRVDTHADQMRVERTLRDLLEFIGQASHAPGHDGLTPAWVRQELDGLRRQRVA